MGSQCNGDLQLSYGSLSEHLVRKLKLKSNEMQILEGQFNMVLYFGNFKSVGFEWIFFYTFKIC